MREQATLWFGKAQRRGKELPSPEAVAMLVALVVLLALVL